ncbi:related to Psi-producing oxygenase A [Cephalotrichum gorgonifer]|uniref:Related to Psi-producing oxygenase A n=1 Tax=Cephalotrichum gorgonifer TaxID=2041049 RepID=A0AAE8SY85_9PEZI|nr:related to Psi-producing oxygenase A [Cephalotrichum gorgonifer]
MPTTQADGHAVPSDSSNITKLLSEARQDLISQSHRILPDLAILQALYQTFLAGGVIDDRKYLVEKIVQLAASLPNGSTIRNDLSGTFVNTLWTTLQHPPISYLGDKFRYRTADGSYNNIMYPHLGEAGSSYARTVTPKHPQPLVRPDPSLIFDSLLARNGPAREHPSKISSNLFYLATIIIHDLFVTDEADETKSRSSAYLDLGPLYGSSQEQQDRVRTFKDGMLKNDAFSEQRLLGQPPGVCAMIVAFNRFHNYVVGEIATINEGGRFSIPEGMSTEDPAYEKAMKNRDEELFQTGRLVTCGLYVNMILNDYLRAILNLNRNPTDTDWRLDPRETIPDVFDPQGTPRGVGNQVSAEFNMIYRWHTAISNHDEDWANEFFADVFGPTADPSKLSVTEFLGGLRKWFQDQPEDPGKWTFGNLKRKEDGSFDDVSLVNLLQAGSENVAGAYGARNTPKVIKAVEILGIQQGRRWGLATLNEFRLFFKLKPYTTFAEVNSDKSVADTMEALYGHPDNIELYPGIVAEEAKTSLEPGSGLCANFTTSFAILSDAVALVRGDRFYSVDYSPSTLTNFGFNAASSDFDVAQGGVMYKLLMQAFPGWYSSNSVYALYPFTTVEGNLEILRQRGTSQEFNFEKPSLTGPPTPITSWKGVVDVLNDQEHFKVPWGKHTSEVTHHDYMLSGDAPANAQQRVSVKRCLYEPQNALNEVRQFYESATECVLRERSRKLGDTYQVDIVADVGNIIHTLFTSQFFGIPLQNSGKGGGDSGAYTESQLYDVLANLFGYVFLDLDPVKSSKHRAVAIREAQRLGKVMTAATSEVNSPRFQGLKSLLGMGKAQASLVDYGNQLVSRILDVSEDVDNTVWTIIPTAAAACATQAQGWAQMIDLFLSEQYYRHWPAIRELALSDAPEAFEKLKKYALEGLRLSTPAFGLIRTVDTEKATIQDGPQVKTVQKGDTVLTSFITAGQDPSKFPDPQQIKLDRPESSYIHHGWGPHECLGRPIVTVAAASTLRTCARLENFRRAPGPMGEMRSKPVAGGFFREFLAADGSEWGPFPRTKKVVFDGFVD